MGHCDNFFCAMRHVQILDALWVTAVNLVMHCGLLRGMKPYYKNLDNIPVMGHHAGFRSALRAIAQDLVMHYGI